jgi:hypothetical protein
MALRLRVALTPRDSVLTEKLLADARGFDRSHKKLELINGCRNHFELQTGAGRSHLSLASGNVREIYFGSREKLTVADFPISATIREGNDGPFRTSDTSHKSRLRPETRSSLPLQCPRINRRRLPRGYGCGRFGGISYPGTRGSGPGRFVFAETCDIR